MEDLMALADLAMYENKRSKRAIVKLLKNRAQPMTIPQSRLAQSLKQGKRGNGEKIKRERGSFSVPLYPSPLFLFPVALFPSSLWSVVFSARMVQSNGLEEKPADGRWRALVLLSLAELLGMSLWFSAAASCTGSPH